MSSTPMVKIERAGETFTLFASAARATAVANSAGTAVQFNGERQKFALLLDHTASGAVAGDTLDVYVDFSFDNVTWFNAVHFTQLAGDAAANKEFAFLDSANPGTATISVTSNAASGAVRPAIFGAYIRGRYTLVDAGAHGQTMTFSLTGYAL